MTYYNNVNPDLLTKISLTAEHILEVGCGSGALARAIRARNPKARYVGVELFPDAAHEAESVTDALVIGNIEDPAVFSELEKARGAKPFDALIFGDVLEHLEDPWGLLTKLRNMMATQGICSICIPNVSHWSLLEQQLRGRWDYADAGLLDRTHVRFFTLDTLIDTLSGAGWRVLDAKPRVLWSEKTAAALKAFEPVAQNLNLDLGKFRRDLSAFQWVTRAVNGVPPENLSIAALSIKNAAGVNEPRVHHPLSALASEPGIQVVIGEGSISIPQNMPPGIFILHRQFVNQPSMQAHLEQLASKGWVLVADMDDDPSVWREYATSDHYAFRAVHAVTVSTPALATVFKQWNPKIAVFQNAILEYPNVSESTPKNDEKIRVFFGALNRKKDWQTIIDGIKTAALQLKEFIEFVVVHDQEFYDALPTHVQKRFYPTLPQADYLKLLSACDLALLPLLDTPFNRLKSDLKFIECCAAQVVPICSKTVYFERAEHQEIGVFPESSGGWASALIRLCGDKDEIKKRRDLALTYLKKSRMQSQQVRPRLEFYRSLLAERESLEQARKNRIAAMSPRG